MGFRKGYKRREGERKGLYHKLPEERSLGTFKSTLGAQQQISAIDSENVRLLNKKNEALGTVLRSRSWS
jgi:hypothetical protein